jgi:hypothetical protein
MSTFSTAIPVDVEAVKRLLPANSFIEGINWNKDLQQVELVWSNSRLVTPFNTATPFTVQQLHDKEIPKAARLKEESRKSGTEPEQPRNIVKEIVDAKPKRGKKPLA